MNVCMYRPGRPDRLEIFSNKQGDQDDHMKPTLSRSSSKLYLYRFLNVFTRLIFMHPSVVPNLCLSLSCSGLIRSHVTYLNWNRGEPNNGGPSNVTEECVMQSKRSGKWNDFPCDTKFNFICKAKGGQLRNNFIFFNIIPDTSNRLCSATS